MQEIESVLDQQTHKHHKIRFRRGDFTSLDSMPSSASEDRVADAPPRRRRLIRWAGAITGVFTALLIAAAAGIYFVGTYGISTDRVREQAETAIRNMAGVDVDAALGPARVSFGSSGLLAVAIDDISIKTADAGASLLEAGSLQFGVEVLPLIGGNLAFGSARVADARIFVDQLPKRGGGDWAASLRDTSGLIDPDLVAKAVFEATHGVFAALTQGQARSITFANVEVVLPEGGKVKLLHLDDASIEIVGDEQIVVSASATVDGRKVTLQGEAERDATSGRIARLDIRADGSEPEKLVAEADTTGAVDAADVDKSDHIGAIALSLTGEEGSAEAASTVRVAMSLGQSRVWIDKRDYIDGTLDAAASVTTGSNKADIEKLHFINGRNSVDFRGAVVPTAATDGKPAHYAIGMISDRSVSAPADSTEPPLEFVARLGGMFEPETQVVTFNEIGLRTASGEMAATAMVDFEPGKMPGISFSAYVPQMAVTQMKQLWPFFAAPGARRWALNRLFGGTITNSRLQYAVVPGRLRNGVPLGRDEVFGRFEVAGTRFDVTGEIPPVRDAVGAVDFHGNDVDVTLTSGTTYLPSGRAVKASAGTMAIHRAHEGRVVGDLELGIEGDAQAIAELASLEPINGLKRVGMTSDEFSGTAKGRIKAEVPIFGNGDRTDFAWHVDLDFENLALAKPIDGQIFTEGSGNITIDPDKAIISAKAKLNGAPAEVSMVEPFGDDGPKRERDIEIVLDNAAREALVPGLGDLLKGPVTVKLDSSRKESQPISADLTDAELNLPWVGWTKGPGIAGKVSFVLENNGGTSRLSKLVLEGKSFSIVGDVTLDDGSLRSAKFSSVKLNRDDNASLTIDRKGKMLKVDIKGSSLDIRSVVSMLTEDAVAATESAGSGPVTLTARLKSLTGFNGEKLGGVDMTYAGTGSRIDAMSVTATTSTGQPVKLSDSTEGKSRTVEMESTDAGAVLRFLDIYKHMEGGSMKFSLAGKAGGTMKGQIDAIDFWIVDEPKLASIVSSKAPGDDRTLNEAVKRDIDTSRVKFERGYALVEKGDGMLALERGVLRGPLIGSTFQGTIYDKKGNIDMTGTFMPAYGINRLFGEIPLVGIILGNGRDRGLIGVTYRLFGKASDPEMQINPLSIIAPGIFRQIFEFR